jgi:hypothetical protein
MPAAGCIDEILTIRESGIAGEKMQMWFSLSASLPRSSTGR